MMCSMLPSEFDTEVSAGCLKMAEQQVLNAGVWENAVSRDGDSVGGGYAEKSRTMTCLLAGFVRNSISLC